MTSRSRHSSTGEARRIEWQFPRRSTYDVSRETLSNNRSHICRNTNGRRRIRRAESSILNSSHTLNFAETACKIYREPDVVALCSSVGDPRDLGRILENTIISKFAVTVQCKGVTVVLGLDPKYDGNFNQIVHDLIMTQKEYGMLNVDYTPVGTRYNWFLLPQNQPAPVTPPSSRGRRRGRCGCRQSIAGNPA